MEMLASPVTKRRKIKCACRGSKPTGTAITLIQLVPTEGKTGAVCCQEITGARGANGVERLICYGEITEGLLSS
eukprot:1162015-Pelagomonas_calceolata.AAC.18